METPIEWINPLRVIPNYPEDLSREEIQKRLKKWVKWVHESVLKSYAVLKCIKEMIERGDSKETIMMVINLFWY